MSKVKVKKGIKPQVSQQNSDDKNEINALELYNHKTVKIPKLMEPFLQTVGLAALVGTSDSGKSTFLRQLSLSLVLNQNDFLKYKLNGTHKKVIYVSTEDDSNAISYSIRKQVNSILSGKLIKKKDLDLLKNLKFIFDATNLHENLTKKLSEHPVDLVIIDAFTDVFTREINANTQVRQFLNSYDVLAKKNKCLIIFLHHIGKRTTRFNPSKDSIIGSQAFEAKMRSVLELRPSKDGKHTELWVLKSNFLEKKWKEKSHILELTKELTFKNTEIKGGLQVNAKNSDPELIKKVLELHKNGLSSRKIEDELKNTPHQVSKSSAALIIKNHKQSNSSSK